MKTFKTDSVGNIWEVRGGWVYPNPDLPKDPNFDLSAPAPFRIMGTPLLRDKVLRDMFAPEVPTIEEQASFFLALLHQGIERAGEKARDELNRMCFHAQARLHARFFWLTNENPELWKTFTYRQFIRHREL